MMTALAEAAARVPDRAWDVPGSVAARDEARAERALNGR